MSPDAIPRPITGVLLTDGSYYGTLAAARYFGRQGLVVALADTARSTFTHWSRFVSERHRLPKGIDFEGLASWLEDFGRRRPGFLLYPCSDDMAWTLARHRERLQAHFAMVQPAFEVIETLLDKRKLYELCARLEIPTPHTAYPSDQKNLVDTVRNLRGRILVKPRTQVGMRVKLKGEIAGAGPKLIETYTRFRNSTRYCSALLQHDPSLAWPMLQRFRPAAATQTINVAGFIGGPAGACHALSSRKVLQYPLTIGVGLCFESVTTPPVLIDSVRRLCAAAGYYGAFEVEFIESDGQFELMDFNPRYYGQMQLEISRGLPVPGLVAAAASGKPVATPDGFSNGRHANRSVLARVMTTQWMARRVTWRERERWLRFAGDDTMLITDHVFDADDPRPAWADQARHYARYLRHPRSSLNTLFGTE